MKTIYLDAFSGISGDMFIGALLDLGVDPKRLELELRKLNLEGYHLHVSRGQKASISGTKFDVHIGEHHHERDEHGEPHEHDQHRHSHEAEHSDLHEHEDEHDDQHYHCHHPGHEHEHEQHHHGGHAEHSHHHGRTFRDIKQLISASDLSDWVKTKSTAVFQRIAIAEGKIHGLPPEGVHFHE